MAPTASSSARTILLTCWSTIRSAMSRRSKASTTQHAPHSAAAMQRSYWASSAPLGIQKIQHRSFRDHGAVGAVQSGARAFFLRLRRLQIGAEMARALDDAVVLA